MAKALGNGVPIGACWARADVAAAFRPGDHATTFGGQPLAARAALAVLDVMEREQVPERAERAGHAARRGAAEGRPASSRCAASGSCSRPSSRAGIDAKDVAQRCMDAGLIVNAVTGSALRLAPPLLVTDAEIDEAVAILAAVLDGGAGEHDPSTSSRSTTSIRRRCARILDRADGVEGRARRRSRRCSPGTSVAALFQKPSARTRISVEVAVATLGGHPIYIRDEEVGIDRA